MERHIIFGVSPFNTKFNEEYIFRMLDWGFSNFSRVDVIHPHEEAKYLLMGCGNDEVKSMKKSRKEYARVFRVVEKYLSDRNNKLYHGRILSFSDYYESEVYKDIYSAAKYEYEVFTDFHNICMSQAEKALNSRKKSIGDNSLSDDGSIYVAVEYILREIPFIASFSEILSSNCHVYISYYSAWSVFDYIYQHGRNIKPSSMTGLVIKDHS